MSYHFHDDFYKNDNNARSVNLKLMVMVFALV